MNIHQNARLTLRGREELVRRVQAGEGLTAPAIRLGVSRQTARKWVQRYGEDAEAGLQDRSSRPQTSALSTTASTGRPTSPPAWSRAGCTCSRTRSARVRPG